MARVFMDGFESGGFDLWDSENNASVISSTPYDVDGDYCLHLYGGTFWVQKDLFANSEYFFSFWFRPRATNSERILKVLNGSTVLCSLYRTNDATGRLKAYSGDGGSLLATATNGTSVDTTYKIQIHIKIDDSVGKFKVVQAGVTEIDFIGDTKPGADTTINSFIVGAVAGEPNFIMDNIIVDNSVMLPAISHIQALFPSGAGNSTGWTPSTGANYECVDERPPSDADYVSINANDVVDTYACGNMAGSIGSVKCVQVQSRTESDGAPTPTNLKLVVRSGATDYLSGDKSVPAAPAGLSHIWETDPDTAAAWLEAGVNAMEPGIKSAA